MIFYILYLLSFFSQASPQLSLRSLTDTSVTKIKQDSAIPNVFVLFQKDCQACRQQIQDLNCLKPVANIFLIGSFSSEEDLRKEYRSFGTSLQGFYGEKEFRESFGVREFLTPQVILIKEKRRHLVLGKTSCKKLLAIIKSEKKNNLFRSGYGTLTYLLYKIKIYTRNPVNKSYFGTT